MSVTVEHGIVTYKGMPGPVITDYRSWKSSKEFAEYDQVATPAASFEAAALFPHARHVHVKDATHYCLYDRPEFVANMLKEFFGNADGLMSRSCAPESISNCTEAEPADMSVSCSAVATS